MLKIFKTFLIVCVLFGSLNILPAKADATHCGDGVQSSIPSFNVGTRTRWHDFWIWRPLDNGCVMDLRLRVNTGTLRIKAVLTDRGTNCELLNDGLLLTCVATEQTSIDVFFDSQNAETANLTLSDLSTSTAKSIDIVEGFYLYAPLIIRRK